VDDEDLVRRLVRTVLEADDYTVSDAASGAEALERIGTEKPDLVILDVMMPDMDGVEVCRRLGPGVTVVMLTARDDPALVATCKEAGAAAFLTKPFSSIELLDLLDELTG